MFTVTIRLVEGVCKAVAYQKSEVRVFAVQAGIIVAVPVDGDDPVSVSVIRNRKVHAEVRTTSLYWRV